MRMKLAAYSLALMLGGTALAAEKPHAAWTVLVWMNGDNNLQKEIASDWVEMAKAPSSDRVNVVVQLDLFEPDGTFRFKVKNEKKPQLPKTPNLKERNMVSGDELAEFVKWGMCEYPAERYALIFSSHGSGPRRLNLDGAEGKRTEPEVEEPAAEESSEIVLPGGVFSSPSRAISADDHSRGDLLFNSEMADALDRSLPKGVKLDVIGFDACLMSMVELAYGLRRSGKVFVASEELIHAEGWNYTHWVGKLMADPSMDGVKLGKILVDSFEEAQKKRNDTEVRTLAAFELAAAAELAKAVSALGDALIAGGRDQIDVAASARSKCSIFAPTSCGPLRCFHHIDIARFADLVTADTRTSPAVKSVAGEVASLVKSMRFANYAGTRRRGDDASSADYGSEGLAIYFPATKREFTEDRLTGSAYIRGAAKEYPIEFVEAKDIHWSDFLQAYYAAQAKKP